MTCSIPGCDRPKHTHGWCGMHAARARRLGDPLAELSRRPNDGPCSVEGCGQPSRKRGWCASHYAQWRRIGEVRPFAYKWSERATECKQCSGPMPPKGLREFCSPACWFNWNRYNGDRPTETTCVGCGCEIDLTARGKRGQLRKVTVKFCRRCKQDYSKYGMTVEQIAERDGLACGICGQLVDLGLSRADGLMCPSIDHIIPRARGGTHDPANLQLAHLYCNMVKSDRVAAKSPDLIGGGSHE